MEANEVIGLSMDNIWRSTQLFYISAPLLLYSIIKGIQDYMRYQMYGEDISYWVGGDRGVMSKNLVKYWTLLLILGAMGAWLYYLIEGRKHRGVLSAVIIVTLTLGIAFEQICWYDCTNEGSHKIYRFDVHQMRGQVG